MKGLKGARILHHAATELLVPSRDSGQLQTDTEIFSQCPEPWPAAGTRGTPHTIYRSDLWDVQPITPYWPAPAATVPLTSSLTTPVVLLHYCSVTTYLFIHSV